MNDQQTRGVRPPEAPPAAEPARPALPPLLLTAGQAAAACNVSPATWHRWAAAGRVPAPLRIGATVRWRRAELEAWTAAGAPDRRTWEALRRDGPAKRDGRS